MELLTKEEALQLAFGGNDTVSIRSIREEKIMVAQERFLRPAFGNELYEELESGKHYEFVTEYVKPALAQYVRYQMIPELMVRLSDSGIVLVSATETEDSTREQSKNKVSETTNSKGATELMQDSKEKITKNGGVTLSREEETERSEMGISNDNSVKDESVSYERDIQSTTTDKQDTSKTTSSDLTGTDTKTTYFVQDTYEMVQKTGSDKTSAKETVKDKTKVDSQDTAEINSTTGSGNVMLKIDESLGIKSTDKTGETVRTVDLTTSLNSDIEQVKESEGKQETKLSKKVKDDLSEEISQERKLTGLTVDEKASLTTDTENSSFEKNTVLETIRKDHTQSNLTENGETSQNSITEHESSGAKNINEEGENQLARTTSLEHLNPASTLQCRMAAQRALTDGNILLRRAIRYIELHPSEFPNYRPWGSGRRCLGGIVLR